MNKKFRFGLNLKILSVLLIGTLIISGFLAWYLNDVIKHSFMHVETSQVRSIQERSENYFEHLLNSQAMKVSDWAVWDDAHNYMLGKQKDFEYVNLRFPENTFKSLNSDILVFKNKNNQILYAKSYDRTELVYTDYVKNLTDFYKSIPYTENKMGFMIDPVTKVPFYYVSRFTTNSDGTAEPSGVIISIVYMDQKFTDAFKKTLKYNISFLPPAEQDIIHQKNDNLIIAIKNFIFENQKPIFSIKVEIERPIYLIFKRTWNAVILALCGSFILFSILIYLFASRSIVNRLRMIQAWTEDFRETKSYKPLPLNSNDEINDVMNSMNEMTEDIQKYHYELEKRGKELMLSSKMVALVEMSANIAHEINSPLATIYGRAQQLQKHIDTGNLSPDRMKKYTDVIMETTERISKIVKSLKNFSRKSTDKLKGDDNQIYEIKEVIDDLISISSDNLKKKSDSTYSR